MRWLLISLLALGCEQAPDFDRIGVLTASMLPPSPTNLHADDPRAAALGQALFFDEGLSADGTVACASCHDPAHGFSDPDPTSEGAFGRRGGRHAPTLVNVAFNRQQMWDGRIDSLWAQPIRAIEAEPEGDFTRVEVAHYVAARHAEAYEAIFGELPDLSELPARAKPGDAAWDALSESQQDAVNRVAANIGKAIEAYERKLLCVDTELDRFLAGDGELSVEAYEGARQFFDEQEGACVRCHSGPNLTDDGFHNLQVHQPEGPLDQGQSEGTALFIDEFNGAGRYSDDVAAGAARLVAIEVDGVEVGAFKTPTLRGVTQRGPYGHLGSSRTLNAWFDDVYDRGRRRRAAGERSRLAPNFEPHGDAMEAFLRTMACPPLPDELIRAPGAAPEDTDDVIEDQPVDDDPPARARDRRRR